MDAMGKLITGVIFFAAVISSCRSADSDEVTFYEDSFYEGDRMFLSLAPGCYNMEKDWNNRVSSVDPQGNCLMAYDYMDCRGSSVKLESGVRGLGDLKRLNFDNAISSLSACQSKIREKPRESDKNGPEIWRIGVEEHNKYRRMHGVPNLKGDPNLHDTAQKHADYLAKNNRFEASTDNKYGENVATSYRKDKGDAIRDVVKRWYDKIELYNFRNPESNTNRPSTGQFTSVVWKSTSYLGIGVAWNKANEKWVIVANYDPPAGHSQFKENVPSPV